MESPDKLRQKMARAGGEKGTSLVAVLSTLLDPKSILIESRR
jgi:hypothetical protein